MLSLTNIKNQNKKEKEHELAAHYVPNFQLQISARDASIQALKEREISIAKTIEDLKNQRHYLENTLKQATQTVCDKLIFIAKKK